MPLKVTNIMGGSIDIARIFLDKYIRSKGAQLYGAQGAQLPLDLGPQLAPAWGPAWELSFNWP